MAALSANRHPYQLERSTNRGGLNGTTGTIWQGALCVYNASGHIVPATTATGLVYAGYTLRQWDNPSGVAGGAGIEVSRLPAGADISGSEPVTQADVGALVYLVDDHTIARTNGTNTRSVAGRLVAIKDGLAYFSPVEP